MSSCKDPGPATDTEHFPVTASIAPVNKEYFVSTGSLPEKNWLRLISLDDNSSHEYNSINENIIGIQLYRNAIYGQICVYFSVYTHYCRFQNNAE